MKKLFLLLAFAGIVGAASANTLLVSFSKNAVAFYGDDKKGDDKKKEAKSCEKGEKSCCKKGEGKSCCHAKAGAGATGEAKPVSDAKATEVKATATPAKK